MPEPTRKGSRRIKDIPPQVLRDLNEGVIESANLVEWLAVDQIALLQKVLTQLRRPDYAGTVLERVRKLKKVTITAVNEAIAAGLLEVTRANGDPELLRDLATHRSDSVRCWAAYAIGRDAALALEEALEGLQSLADDPHFGVREVAWMAFRPRLFTELTRAISRLVPWAFSSRPNLRRFASEVTRPRGVWCQHLAQLKESPGLGQPILEPLKSDPVRYVQDSVGNWLNDASKTQPAYVVALCQRWLTETEAPATQYIAKRALRNVSLIPAVQFPARDRRA